MENKRFASEAVQADLEELSNIAEAERSRAEFERCEWRGDELWCKVVGNGRQYVRSRLV